MCSLRLVLGCDQLLETEQAALPALLGLCQALHIPAHWHEQDQTLYIAAPILEKRIILAADSSEPVPYREQAAQMTAALYERLAAAGAHVTWFDGDGVPTGTDLFLHIRVVGQGSPGVSAAYSWLTRHASRKLGTALIGELARSCGLPDQGARVALTGKCLSGAAGVTVTVARPDLATPAPDFLPQAAHALYVGLAKFWASPLHEAVWRAVPELCASPVAAPQEIPEDPEPEPEPEPESEPASELISAADPDLDPLPEPDPIPDPAPEPDPITLYEPDPEPVLILGPETVLSHSQEPLPQPPVPAPPPPAVARQPQPPDPCQLHKASVLLVFEWPRALKARSEPAPAPVPSPEPPPPSRPEPPETPDPGLAMKTFFEQPAPILPDSLPTAAQRTAAQPQRRVTRQSASLIHFSQTAKQNHPR